MLGKQNRLNGICILIYVQFVSMWLSMREFHWSMILFWSKSAWGTIGSSRWQQDAWYRQAKPKSAQLE
jgi:hypothetical protein